MRGVLILVVLMLSACGSGGDVAPALPAKASTIACTVAYRASVSQPIERDVRITFTEGDEQSITFPDLLFHAAYSEGEADNERTVRLWVTDLDNERLYQSHLFQLDPQRGPLNQFQGGHGFTGLTYAYPPTSTAELQFWCEAE